MNSPYISKLTTLALELTNGDQEYAQAWLNTPMDLFNGKTPLEYTVDEKSFEDVETLIGRLCHGVFT